MSRGYGLGSFCLYWICSQHRGSWTKRSNKAGGLLLSHLFVRRLPHWWFEEMDSSVKTIGKYGRNRCSYLLLFSAMTIGGPSGWGMNWENVHRWSCEVKRYIGYTWNDWRLLQSHTAKAVRKVGFLPSYWRSWLSKRQLNSIVEVID